MRGLMCGRSFTLAMIAVLACPPAQADDAYRGKWFRVTGQWDGTRLSAERIDWREAGDDARRGQVSGRVDQIDPRQQSLKIGPFVIGWSEKTDFEGVSAKQLKPGVIERVNLEKLEHGRFLARSIEARAVPSDGRTLQLTGQATQTDVVPSGAMRMMILGIPVHLPQDSYNGAKSLTRRQDSRRPDEPLQTVLFGRPLTFSGEYSATLLQRDNFKLDDRYNRLLFDQEFKIELFYPLGRTTALFAEVKALHEAELRDVFGTREEDAFLERGPLWLYAGGRHFGLQIGRQNIAEVREWWWEDDLDAIRIYYDRGPWHAEVGVARELARVSTRAKGIDVQHDGVARVFGVGSWLWAPKQRLEFFALHQDDRSDTQGVGQVIDAEREDPSDAKLTWLGLRAIGEPSLGGYGSLLYWVDSATVRGDESVLKFDEVSDTMSSVKSRSQQKVRGYAVDAGASWATKLLLRPTFTLAYAYGSGDADSGDNVDRSFRQTGLHENKWRFSGVNRFRYYGELLRPELANLGIATVAVGFPLHPNSSVELLYHRYRQAEAADFLREVRIDADLTGESRDIGSEIDLVLGFREWRRWDLEFIASTFKAGKAYGAASGKRAYSASFEATFNF